MISGHWPPQTRPTLCWHWMEYRDQNACLVESYRVLYEFLLTYFSERSLSILKSLIRTMTYVKKNFEYRVDTTKNFSYKVNHQPTRKDIITVNEK